jgi:tRNA (guanine-N7-)-methyltransferase
LAPPEDRDGRAPEPAGPDAPRRLYGRKRGRKLRPAQAARLETLLPRLAVPLPPPGERLDWRALFPRPMESLWLEVGFGAGEHLAWQAERHRQVGLIGCEPFVQGVAQLLRTVEERGLDNVRLVPDDARPLTEALPDGCVGRCFVLFPDPWPKRRHWGRRFLSGATLDLVARVMAVGGELRLASDNPHMLDWMLWHARAHPAFAWTARRAADWRSRPDDWPPTRYERKALHGTPAFLRFVRVPAAR